MTTVELLTVIVIIGVLSAIAMPAFFLHRDRARDAQAKASARAAQTAAMEVGTENDGRFDGPKGVTVLRLVSVDPSLAGEDLSVPLATAETFTVRIRSDTGNTFDVKRNSDGTTNLTCASADDAGCPSDGSWD